MGSTVDSNENNELTCCDVCEVNIYSHTHSGLLIEQLNRAQMVLIYNISVPKERQEVISHDVIKSFACLTVGIEMLCKNTYRRLLVDYFQPEGAQMVGI